MKKIIAIFILIMTILSLVACGDGGQTTPTDPTPDKPADNRVSIEYKSIIRGTSSPDLSGVVSAIRDKSDRTLYVMDDSNAAILGEIVFGSADRDVTREAAAALASIIDEAEKDGEDFFGYVIYKDAKGNVAVYWSEDYEGTSAVELFISDYANLDVLNSFYTGLITQSVVSVDDYIYESTWGKLEKEAPAEVFEAMQQLAKMFDGSAIIDWMANLWEPYICVCGKCADEGKEIACYGGGFYYANSARDYEGFLPDMENTAFVLNWISNHGAFERYLGYAEALPEVIKNKIIKFVQSLQSEADGYFYHPQWGTNINTDRRGRDLSNAVDVLKKLGAKPLYPTALDRLNGKTAALTERLGLSPAVAVSAVVGTASSFEESLKSEKSYMEWLKATTNGLFENTAGAHTINAGKSQIIAAGYLDITLDYFDEKQEELFLEMKAAYDADPVNNPMPTGLWQRHIDYNAVWGLLKLAPFYSEGNREIKYAEYAMRTCVSCIMIDADEGGNYHMNDVYNQWSSASNLISNVKKHNKELLPKLYEIANENAVEMISNSIDKLSRFIHEDGTYGYNQGTSAPSLYGTPVSLGLPEGDVNATILACGMYSSVFSVLGYQSIKLCDYRDGERFIETIMSLGSAEKKDVPTGDPLDFEDGDVSGVSTSFNSGGYIEVVTDPKNPSNSVLKVVNNAGANDGVSFKSGGNSKATCYIYEADMMISASNVSYFSQIYFGSIFMFDMTCDNGTVGLRVNPTNTGTGYVKKLNFSAAVGEWFRLRIECYVDPDGSGVPIAKIYKNGVLVDTSTAFYGSHVAGAVASAVFDTVRFWSMRAAQTDMYFDNVYVARVNKDYVAD